MVLNRQRERESGKNVELCPSNPVKVGHHSTATTTSVLCGLAKCRAVKEGAQHIPRKMSCRSPILAQITMVYIIKDTLLGIGIIKSGRQYVPIEKLFLRTLFLIQM